MFLYPTHRSRIILDESPVIQELLQRNTDPYFSCPYDKLILCSDSYPDPRFIDCVRPARIQVEDGNTYYRHQLRHEMFSLFWGQMNPSAPVTSIMLNPWKHKLTPDELISLVSFIMGGIQGVFVSKYDEKVDLLGSMSTGEYSRRLYIGYQRKVPQDYNFLGETYLYGKRNGQQVKNYDKAAERKLECIEWTRIERTRKERKKHGRQTLVEFLCDERADAFKHTIVVDIDKFDGRLKIMKRIREYGTFQEAFMSLNVAEKRQIKRHEAFRIPLLDLGKQFRFELNKWMMMSPMLYDTFNANIDKTQ